MFAARTIQHMPRFALATSVALRLGLAGSILAACGSVVAPSQDPATAISDLVGRMASAVQKGDKTGYMALVDPTALADPGFALEHSRWADEWSGAHPVSRYGIQVGNLALNGETATARLTVSWAIKGVEDARVGSFDAGFAHTSAGGRYAGETWTATTVPHFVVKTAPGTERVVPGITDALPEIFTHVTGTLGYEPGAPMTIKLYATAPALAANTLLSLPDINGWNEPGEALKLRLPEDPASLTGTIAHELTHFVLFDRAGTKRTRMPWWLDEGTASYVASSYSEQAARDQLADVHGLAVQGKLADWRQMAVFETTPQSMWRYVYPQGYAMVRYITERYGEAKRNAWLASMATEMDIDAATPAAFGVSFDQLAADFQTWAIAQR